MRRTAAVLVVVVVALGVGITGVPSVRAATSVPCCPDAVVNDAKLVPAWLHDAFDETLRDAENERPG